MSSSEAKTDWAAKVKPCLRWSSKVGPALTEMMYGLPSCSLPLVSDQYGLSGYWVCIRAGMGERGTYLECLCRHAFVELEEFLALGLLWDLEEGGAVDGHAGLLFLCSA